MFKHSYCGGQHETVDQARHCEAANTPEVAAGARAIRESQTPDETWPWAEPTKAERPAPKRFEDRPRTRGDLDKRNGPMPLGMAYAYALKGQTSPVEVPEFIAPAGPIDRTAILSHRVDSLMNSGVACSGRNSGSGGATEPMRRFITVLLQERDWEHAIDPQSQNGETVSDLGNGEWISFASARLLIETLKALPKVGAAPVATPAPKAKDQPWKALSKEVPEGNYCVEIDGKNHFYRVSVSERGFFKIQERASDELFFIPLARYAGILKTILDAGVEASRLRYAKELSRCWHCHRTLTDNTGNPHFSRGLGPYCGDEH